MPTIFLSEHCVHIIRDLCFLYYFVLIHLFTFYDQWNFHPSKLLDVVMSSVSLNTLFHSCALMLGFPFYLWFYHVLMFLFHCSLLMVLDLQLFDGKEGRPKYPRRWVILPPFLWENNLNQVILISKSLKFSSLW